MRKLYILILMLVIGLASEAQPQYWNRLPTVGANAFPFQANPAAGKKVQWAVAFGEFNQPSPAPASNITSIWFRPNAVNTTTFTTLTIRLATVSTSTFIPGIGQWYTGPMTTVRSQNTTMIATAALQWVEIPLTTAFPYDPTMNLIIEVYQCGYTGPGFTINHDIIDVAPNYRRAYSDAASACGVTVLPASGQFNIPAIGLTMGVSIPCATPAAQPTGLILTPVSQVQINGSFTAAAPAPTNYLVVRYPFGAVPTNPVNGTNYLVGAALGTGTVVSVSNATTFTSAGLTPNTQYSFYVYSYNTGPSCATNYRTVTPLFGSQTTLPCAGPPTITCPPNMTVNNTPGLCGANVTYPAATTTGTPAPTVTYSQASGTFFPRGVTTVTATATSVCGTAACTFTITVVDNQPPTIVCPANITVNNTPNLCSAVVTYPMPTALDNCPFPGSVPLSITQNSSNTVTAGSVSCNAGGLHTDNSYWRAYDLGPMALTGPFTVNSVTFGIELANAAGVGTTQPVTVRVHTSAGAFPGGVRTQVASQTFNIPDQTLSLYTATLAAPPTVAANAILVLEIFTPDGQVAGHSFFIGSNALPETAPSYLSAVACGVPTPVTVASLGFPNMHTIINAAGLVSNPSGSITQIAGLPSGAVFPVGVTTNTFRVTDAGGNTATCSFTVTVVDNQAPAVTCPANIVANTDVGACVATVVTPNPTTSDNCAVTQVTWAMTGATVASSPATGINYVGTRPFNLNGTTGQGVTTITYTVKDAAGNTTTCSFTVTVNDAWIPVIGGQPTTQTVCVGSDALFSVTANVPAGNPLTYQWQAWNGTAWVNITGATAATLPLPAVPFSLNTSCYRVILTGRCSVVTSVFACLYVNQLPTVSILASGPLALLPAQTLTLTAVVNPGGGTYQWRKNGVVIAATGASLNLTVDDIGSYTVTYTDLNGCKQTSAVMVVSGQASDKVFIYPNPNNGQFKVRYYTSSQQLGSERHVILVAQNGQRVFDQTFPITAPYSIMEIDARRLPKGSYIVMLTDAFGKEVVAHGKVLILGE